MKIKLNLINPSKTNPRKNFDDQSLQELAESIKNNGLQFPILVREIGGKLPYELVDGERRWKAAKIAGLAEIEAICRIMTDEEAEDAQMISFEQDADIHPLEKAEAFKRMLIGSSVVTLANKISKPLSYVEKILKLLDLIAPAKKAFLANRFTLEHAIQVARCQPNEQERCLTFMLKTWQEYDGLHEYSNDINPEIENFKLQKHDQDAPTACSVKDLKDFIDCRIHLDLANAAFDKKDATLIESAGNCVNCPKRSGFNKELFNDITKQDICTDPDCFAKKQEAFTIKLKAELKRDKKKYQEITRDRCKPDGHPGAMTERSFIYVKGKPCKFTRTGVFIDADSKGKTALICSAKHECKVHFNASISRDPVVEKKEKTQNPEQIEKQRIEKVKGQINSEVNLRINEALLPKIAEKLPTSIDKNVLSACYEIIEDSDYNDHDIRGLLKIKGKLEDQKEGTLNKMLHLAVVMIEAGRYDAEENYLSDKAKSLGIDIKPIDKEIREKVTKEHAKELISQLPEPKKPVKEPEAKKPVKKSKGKK